MEPEGPKLYDITLRETAPEENEDIEKGLLSRKLNEPEDLATSVTQHIKLKEGEEGVELWKKHSIYKVHAAIAAVNPKVFTPKVVSVGPYHHGKEHLMPMEVHKQRAARRFIEDSGKSIKDFIDGLWEVLPELMDSYSQLDRVWREDKNKGRFLELMLIDGCFLLEILRIVDERRPYDEHDPVFSVNGIISHAFLAGDLMMLENQVPFTALEKLLTIKNGRAPEQNSKYIKDLMLVVLYRRKNTDMRKGKHMLDVATSNLFKIELVLDEAMLVVATATTTGHGGLVGANEETLQYIKDTMPAKKLRSVMELCRAGVEFRKAEDETIPLSSIRFENNGIITIPVIPLHMLSEVEGCNMVAFELIHPETLFPTSSYFTFMKGLLTSAADVRHLRTAKIIESTESSDDAIVETFKRIATSGQMVLPGTNLYQVQDQLDKFYLKWMTGCRGRIWEWFTSLMQKYFKNPWTSISVAAAIILLVLSAVQTYYTGLPYWDSKHRKNN